MEFLNSYNEGEVSDDDNDSFPNEVSDNKINNIQGGENDITIEDNTNTKDSNENELNDDDEDYEQHENDEIMTEYGDESEDDLNSQNNNDDVIQNSSIQKVGNESINIDSYCNENKIPISYQIDLKGHDKAVSCFSIEPSGNRVITGSLDYSIRAYDFGGMDR